MAAITWRELVGAPDTGAFRALSGATETINAGFDALNKTLAQRQVATQAAYDKGQDAQSVAFREALANATSEADVNRIKAQRDTYLAGLDPTRRAQLVGAEEARLGSLRQNTTAAQQFDDAQLYRTHLPTINEASAAYARGDQATGDNLMAKVPTNVVEYAKTVAAGMKAVEDRKKFADDMLNSGTKRALEGAQTTQAQAEATAIPQRVANAAEQNRIAARDSNIRLLGAIDGGGGGGGHGAGGPGVAGVNTADTSAATLTTGLGAMFKDDPVKAQVMDRIVATAMNHKDPKVAAMLRDLPPDVVLRIAQEHSADFGTGKWNPTDGFAVGNIQSDMLKALDNPSVKAQMLAQEASRLRAGQRRQESEVMRQSLVQGLFPGVLPPPGAAPSNAAAAAPASPEASAAAELLREGKRGSPAADAPVSPEKVDATLLRRQAEIEQKLVQAGELKELSPEVAQYLAGAQGQDAGSGGPTLGESAGRALRTWADLGNAASDIITLPLHGAGNFANTLLRVPNSFGAGIPNIPDVGGRLSSLTPYTDAQRLRDDGKFIVQDLKKELAALKKAQK